MSMLPEIILFEANKNFTTVKNALDTGLCLTFEQVFIYNGFMINKEINCESESNNGVGKIRKKMPDTEILYELADFFKVMGDGTRIRILWALEDDEMCAGDLAVLLDMTQSAISHQLKVLRMSKLVKIRKSGKNVYYSLDDNHVKMILKKSLEHVKE